MTSPTTAPTLPEPVTLAWQDALAAEHAAIFGYDTLGPRLVASNQAIARAFEVAHRARRDATAASMVGAGLTPVSSRDDYPVPLPITSPANATRLALRLEDAAARAWRYLLASAAQSGPTSAGTTPNPSEAGAGTTLAALRASALTTLTESAVRATHWRAQLTPRMPTTAFPGIDP